MKNRKNSKCWECNDSGTCSCICCGEFKRNASGEIVWSAGPCIVCKARAFRQRHAKVLDAANPRNPDNWRTVAASDGNKGWREYLPLRGLK